MSKKQPMKFMPPDDPTAVYPIGALKNAPEEDPEPEELPPPPEPAPPPEPLGFEDDLGSPSVQPEPVEADATGGVQPLLVLAFLAGGILLAVLGVAAVGAVLVMLQ